MFPTSDYGTRGLRDPKAGVGTSTAWVLLNFGDLVWAGHARYPKLRIDAFAAGGRQHAVQV